MDEKFINDCLKKFLLKFNKYKEEDVDLIIKNTVIETFNKGDVILQHGKVCRKCYLVIKGCLRKFQFLDGVDKTCGFYFEGSPIVVFKLP